MLDRRTGAFLQRLNTLCKTSGFCVVEEDEIAGAGENSDSVRGMLSFLKEHGYLDVEYAQDGEYCVRILPEGRLYHERAQGEFLQEERKRRAVSKAAFWGAFFGALLGGMLIAALGIFIIKYVH